MEHDLSPRLVRTALSYQVQLSRLERRLDRTRIWLGVTFGGLVGTVVSLVTFYPHR